MELNYDDSELIEQAVRRAQNYLVFGLFNIHLKDQVSGVVRKILVLPACKRHKGPSIGRTEKFLVEDKFRP